MKTNYENTGLLEMIFENRNKAYGAYALRSDYNQRISRALLVSTSVVFLLCFGKLLSDKLKNEATKIAGHTTILDLQDINLQDPVKIEPPKQAALPPQAKGLQTMRNVEMRVSAQSNLTDSMPPNDLLAMAEAGTTTNMNGNMGIGVTDAQGTEETYTVAAPTPETVVESTIHTIVEEMPEFPGGEKAMMKFLVDNTEYPNMERENDMSGKVLVRFVVNEDGSISQITSLRETTKGFASEAKRVVALMPKFKPGRQQGRAVKVQFILPIQFTLGR